LILCDCEGYESELIDPGTVPELIDCFMIIELHEFAVPGVTADIVARFSHTHEIALVDAVSREADRPPQLSHLTYAQLRRATDEGRPQDPRMQWAVMRPICTR
jgi:hypothetical protein